MSHKYGTKSKAIQTVQFFKQQEGKRSGWRLGVTRDKKTGKRWWFAQCPVGGFNFRSSLKPFNEAFANATKATAALGIALDEFACACDERCAEVVAKVGARGLLWQPDPMDEEFAKNPPPALETRMRCVPVPLCPNDTNGDGDCHLCVNQGDGCPFYNRA